MSDCSCFRWVPGGQHEYDCENNTQSIEARFSRCMDVVSEVREQRNEYKRRMDRILEEFNPGPEPQKAGMFERDYQIAMRGYRNSLREYKDIKAIAEGEA